MHLEAKTAYLCRVMEMGGAEMYVTGSNPLSTQDDVAAALASRGMQVFARYGCTMEEYESCLCSVLEAGPNIIIDDGGDLVHLMHTKYTDLIPKVIGGCEETTTGIHRLRAMARAGTLRFPMVMVNDADCKHMFDNRYGTGQSVWDGIMRTTNLIVAGKGPGGQGRRHRNGPCPRPGGGDGRLPGHAHGGGRQTGRHVHYRHRMQRRHHRRAF